MKKLFNSFLFLTAAIFTFTSCDKDVKSPLIGTWKNEDIHRENHITLTYMHFTNDKLSITSYHNGEEEGTINATYTYNNDYLFVTYTDFLEESKEYSYTDTLGYMIRGNELTLLDNGEISMILTKQ
ncbi:MAG: hypothetical protein MJ204_07350 [Bacteroidales bacterium]|nr:hypothetical protein [Bacteroidales bacterium]